MASKKKKNYDELDLQVKEVPKFSPLDLQFNGTTEAEYQEPVVPVDDWRDGFEREYGWLAPNNVAGVYRAILQELYRLRVGK